MNIITKLHERVTHFNWIAQIMLWFYFAYLHITRLKLIPGYATGLISGFSPKLLFKDHDTSLPHIIYYRLHTKQAWARTLLQFLI